MPRNMENKTLVSIIVPFKDKPEQVIPASLTSSEGSITGRKREESLQAVNG